jgi:hypothetical protein
MDSSATNIDTATAIVRAAGERTQSLCAVLLEQQVSGPVITIEEAPFSRAVIRTFELGLKAGRKWTIAVDADVLVRPVAIREIAAVAEAADETVFEVQGRIFDRLFQGPRSGGLHLYRTSMLEAALEFANREEAVHRPEFHVIQAMEARGFPQLTFDTVLGLHDFEQSYHALYRKGFVHAQKHNDVVPFLERMWQRLAASDADFQAAILGLEAGRNVGGIARTDIRAFGDSIDTVLQQNGLNEKESLPDSATTCFNVERLLETVEPAPEFLEWEELELRRAKEAPLMRAAYRLFLTLPTPVQRIVRTLLNRQTGDEKQI